MAKKRLLPKRIWVCGGRIFRTEEQFVSAYHESDKREVVIYEEVERGIAGKIKSHIVSQRERDEQITILIDDEDSMLKRIMDFKNMLISYKPDSKYTKDILNSLKNIGMNKKAFERIINNHKHFILYEVSNTEEWYKCVLKCHNFIRIPTKGYYNYDKRKYEQLPATAEMSAAFNSAKSALRKSKIPIKPKT